MQVKVNFNNLSTIDKTLMNNLRPSYPARPMGPPKNNAQTRFSANQKINQSIMAQHKKFTFSRPDELVDKTRELPTKRQKRSEADLNFTVIANETDVVGSLVRRIVYAEGDVVNITYTTMQQLKTELKSIVDLLMHSKDGKSNDDNLRELDMGLLCYVFKEQISRFIRTTKLTKRYDKDKEDGSQQDQEEDFAEIEEDKDEIDADAFGQNNMEGLSDFVGSEKDEKEDIEAKPAVKTSPEKSVT